ncbi:MAG: immunoglobulin domain-containing protein [Planctomycetes bacterium]|nr:immunoglobulin domain-containing protein [Planctomycetota bacterium]
MSLRRRPHAASRFLAVTALVGPAFAGVDFFPRVDVSMPSTRPNALVAFDMDADGDVDLATANFSAASVSLLRNDGAGGFVVSGTVAVGTNPVSLDSGDLDGDGDVDLVVALYTLPGSLVVLGNNGLGTFVVAGSLTGVNRPADVVIGQFAPGAALDIAAANQGGQQCSGSVTVHPGLGGLVFGAPTTYAVGCTPWQITAAQMDNSNGVDLAVTNDQSSSVSILASNSGGTFQPALAVATPGVPNGIAARDMDLDGRVDLVLGHRAGTSATVMWNNGALSFTSASFPAGFGPSAVAADLLGCDGLPDIVVANDINSTTATVTVLEGLGARAFAAGVTFTVDGDPRSIVVASLDASPHKDIATANTNESSVSILRANSSGSGPTITQQPPASWTNCNGVWITLSVAATGAGTLSYQWYKNGVPIGGATGSTLTVPAPGPGDSGAYHCQVSNPCGTTASNTCVVTVGGGPTITQQPANTTVCTGASTSLSVTATSLAAFPITSYQWVKAGSGPLTNTGPYSGVNTPTLTIAPASAGTAGAYFVTVANGCNFANSSVAILTVAPFTAPTSATATPATVCANAGGTIQLVATGGAGEALRWRRDSCSGPLVGTGTPLTIAAPAADTVYYASWESTNCGATACASASVTVLPAPANDACANAAVIGLGTTPYDTRCATDGGPAGCSIVKGVFHAYSMSVCGTLQVLANGTTAGYAPAFSIHRDGCSGPSLACSVNGVATVSVEAGAQLLIHTGSTDGSTGAGQLVLALTPLVGLSNDESTGAVPIPSGLGVQVMAFDSTCATDSAAAGCPVRKDAWFRYESVLCTDVTLTVSGAAFPAMLAVHDTIDGTLTACGVSPLAFQAQSGRAYDVRVGSSQALGGPGTLVASSATCGSCSSCPPNSTPERIQVYVLTGDANGTPWAWSLQSSVFCGITQFHVPGVASGTACDVAARFRDSINGSGCGTGSLTATSGCLPAVGTTPVRGTLTIRMGGGQPFDLRVGPEGAVPSCLVSSFGNTCTINPTIQQVAFAGQDCNGNGVDDVIDVADNTSFDLDGDFVPDECALPARFCSGDGSATPCPCGNSGAPGNGCNNSLGVGGARLDAYGVARLTNDTLRLDLTGVPAVASVLYFQGTARENGGAGTVLGDGLLCTSGALIRLGARNANGGTSSFGFGVGADPLISVRGQIPGGGATRSYQAWYRNAANFCTPSTFNLSNGLELVWAP